MLLDFIRKRDRWFVTSMLNHQTVSNIKYAEVLRGEIAGEYNSQKLLLGIRTLCRQGKLKQALRILDRTKQRSTKTYLESCVCVLQGCAKMNALDHGREAHVQLLKSGLKPSIFMWNTLINMYARCRSMKDARQVLNEMTTKNIFTWTMVIAGYFENGSCQEALDMFKQMESEGLSPDRVMFICILNVCAKMCSLEQGKHMHVKVMKANYESDVFIGNTLINMYGKCGSIRDACYVFNVFPARDVVSWNSMITGLLQHNNSKEALELFAEMDKEDLQPNNLTFVAVLTAFAALRTVAKGKYAHGHILKAGYQSDAFVGNTLIDMYGKCGGVEAASHVFDRIPVQDIISWNVMISGYVQHGYSKEAILLFAHMRLVHLKPDRCTFLSIMGACAEASSLELGRKMHADVLKSGYIMDIFVGSTLVDMYAKSGFLEDACNVFDTMPTQGIVSWNSVIAGYSLHEHGREGLKLFKHMQLEGLKPDIVTFIIALSTCADISALGHGKRMHVDVLRNEWQWNSIMGNTLVDMYAKCGRIDDAYEVFINMPIRGPVSWNALIAGFAQHGDGLEVINLFQLMLEDGAKPDHVTCASTLIACSHACLVDEGCHFFCLISHNLNTTPVVKHYSCIVNLLGRAGLLDETNDVLSRMPFEPSLESWRSFVGSCVINSNAELAKPAIENLLELDPYDPATYVLLLNTHRNSGAQVGVWE